MHNGTRIHYMHLVGRLVLIAGSTLPGAVIFSSVSAHDLFPAGFLTWHCFVSDILRGSRFGVTVAGRARIPIADRDSGKPSGTGSPVAVLPGIAAWTGSRGIEARPGGTSAATRQQGPFGGACRPR